MLLSALYEYAKRKDLLAEQGFEEAPVRWIIPLTADGRLIGLGPVDTATDELKRGKVYKVPATARPKTVGGVAEFLADGITGVFGIDPEPNELADATEPKRARRLKNNKDKFDDFWGQVERAAGDPPTPLLKALLHFKNGLPWDRDDPKASPAPFLRWGLAKDKPAGDAQPPAGKGKRAKKTTRRPKEEKEKWWVTCADGSERPLGNDKFTFEVGGVLVFGDPAVRRWWSDCATRERDSERTGSRRGLCLVTGHEDVDIAATHGAIQGVPGTLSTGAKIASYHEDAYRSFGFEQGQNGPVSIGARDGYAAALNHLLANEHHRLRIGETVAVWWTRDGEPDFMRLLDAPTPDAVAELLVSPWAGRGAPPADGEDFFSVVLAGNNARIAVRHWLQQPVRAAIENLGRWFADLEIAPVGERRTDVELSLKSLALTTVPVGVERRERRIRADVALPLYRAALEQLSPPLSLLSAVLARLDVLLAKVGYDALYEEARFALLRLIVNRNRQEGVPMIEPQLTDTNDAAYNCGRLLAVLQSLQSVAHEYELKGPGVVEKYYGTASTAPGTVLPVLLRLGRHHLRKLRQLDKGGAASRIEHELGEICARFQGQGGDAPSFPAFLSLAEQGRFALGFYQQEAHRRRQIQDNNNKTT